MISPESLVFTNVANALKAEITGYSIYSEYTEVPAKFPAITVVESNNTVLKKMRSLKIENAVSLTYEVNIYSNAVGGNKKVEVKKIQDIVDRAFESMGFTRTACNPMENLQDTTIYRLYSRYEGVADKEFRIYTN